MKIPRVKKITTMKSVVLALYLLATMSHGKDLAKPHVVNGQEAIPHSYPHMVALQKVEHDNQTATFCGGSLLSEIWVITAAHCVDRNETMFVTVGAHNVSLKEETQQTIDISEVIIHPGWSMEGIKNDIALVKLKDRPRIDGKTVKPIRLPKLSDKGKSFYNYDATLTGWGRTKASSYSAAETLQEMTERVMSTLTCQAAFLFLFVENTNICTHGIRLIGGCNGDSGGPLILTEEDGERTLVGVTSFGLPTCTLWPSVFTRVSSYVDWIHAKSGLPVRN